MKNRRALLMMGLAILLGLMAVLLASHWLLRQTPVGKGKIVVAAADVNLGQRLTPDMLRLTEWPAESLPQGALQDPQPLAGRVLKSSMLRGEPLSEAKLASVGTLGGLSALITEGRLDITVSTQQDAGDRNFPQSRNISKIVLERILVLAVAQEVGRDETKPRVVNAVTLEVTPDQAENLDLARSVGSLSLVLRNQVDPQPGVTTGATKLSLLGEAPSAPPAAPATVLTVAAALKPPRPVLRSKREPPRHCSALIDGTRQSRVCF